MAMTTTTTSATPTKATKRELFRFLGPGMLLLLAFLRIHVVQGKGEGPIGICPVTDEIVFAMDSSLPGIVVINMTSSTVVERINLEHYLDDFTNQPVSISTCLECDFAFVTTSRSRLLHLQFPASVQSLLQTPGASFVPNPAQSLTEIFSWRGDSNMTDHRIADTDPSADGRYIFVAALDDSSVYRIDMSEFPAEPPMVKRIFQGDFRKQESPYGILLDSNGQNLLVTMLKRFVYRINQDGSNYVRYDLNSCPGIELDPNLRQSMDDPTTPSSILVMASQKRWYDAVIWRYNYVTSACVVVAGRNGYDSGWVDAVGKDIRFTRPHHYKRMPNLEGKYDHQILISDIDNRALRLLNVETFESSTIMYDRDRRAQEMLPGALLSQTSCGDVPDEWLSEETEFAPSTATEGGVSVVFNRGGDQPDEGSSFADALAYCESFGARLCEPAELRASGLGRSKIAWTSGECASCWQNNVGDVCKPELETDRMRPLPEQPPRINQFFPIHSTRGFRHSWNDGFAAEHGEFRTNDGRPQTKCPGFDRETLTSSLLYDVMCCADCFDGVVPAVRTAPLGGPPRGATVLIPDGVVGSNRNGLIGQLPDMVGDMMETQTAMPSVFPSSSPTAIPTDHPTTLPTASPSEGPPDSSLGNDDNDTNVPTAIPIQSPTDHPTAQATGRPTALPTKSLMNTPSNSTVDDGANATLLTAIPSEPPTEPPMKVTSDQTILPTVAPVQAPLNATLDERANNTVPTTTSSSPTRYPTAEPTDHPVTLPPSSPMETLLNSTFDDRNFNNTSTAMPSESPTGSLTAAPSVEPTILPTLSPFGSTLGDGGTDAEETTMPSEPPTDSPTPEPSHEPTILPTPSPTLAPSQSPVDEKKEDIEPIVIRTGVIFSQTHSGKCIDVDSRPGDEHVGANVHQFRCHLNKNQQFTFIPDGPGGTFRVVANHSGMCLAVQNGSTRRGISVVQLPCTGEAHQLWRPEETDTPNLFELRVAHTDMCMSIAGNGSNTLNNFANIIQWPCYGASSQEWHVFALD